MASHRTLFASVLFAMLCSTVVFAGDECCRVYMAADGEQGSQPTSGATLVTVDQGATVTIMAWLHASQMQMQGTNAYQLIWETDAIPEPGSSGTVQYVDGQMGTPGVGDSIVLDTTRSDWLFASIDPILTPSYCEMSGGPGCGFGVIYSTVDGLGVDVTNPSDVPLPGEPMYLVEFTMQASSDACGSFSYTFNKTALGDEPPTTAFFSPFGAGWNQIVFQPLTIFVDCCGNGTLDPGEDCEPPGGCCDDACQIAGAGEVCDAGDGNCVLPATCDGATTDCPTNEVETLCIDNDGCCPFGCSANSDNDCPPICGNGILEIGECCDDGNLDECDGCASDCLCEGPCLITVPVLSQWSMAVMVVLLLLGVALLSRRQASSLL